MIFTIIQYLILVELKKTYDSVRLKPSGFLLLNLAYLTP